MAQEIKLEDYDDKFGEFFEEIKRILSITAT